MPRHICTARFADGLVSVAFDSGTRADASVMPRGSTSSRRPRYTAWRRCGSLVQPVNVTSATSFGSIQWIASLAGTGPSNGVRSVAHARSIFAMRVSSRSVKPLPTWPT